MLIGQVASALYLVLAIHILNNCACRIMRRQIQKRQMNSAIVVIADGETEKWYIEKVKEYYKPDVLRKIKIQPDLVQKKKVAELFSEAEDKVNEGYSLVVLIVDFDEIGKKNNELNKFKELYNKYLDAKSGTARVSPKTRWMRQLVVIVNSPCIEYWYLLHFKNTTKYYANFDSMKPDLTAFKDFKEYKKKEDYYKKRPDIFCRLGAEQGLAKARANASAFDLNKCMEAGFSEMFRLFDEFDKI